MAFSRWRTRSRTRSRRRSGTSWLEARRHRRSNLPPSLEAHDLYLLGRYFKEKRSAEGLRQAAGCFAQATEKDPAYALAWIGLADATALQNEYDQVLASSVLPKARQSALRAIELDPRLAKAHATLGLIAMYSYQGADAEQAYRKAIELNPKYPTAHHWYALLLVWQGRIPEAYAEMDRAYRLDPTSPILNNLVLRGRCVARPQGLPRQFR